MWEGACGYVCVSVLYYTHHTHTHTDTCASKIIHLYMNLIIHKGQLLNAGLCVIIMSSNLLTFDSYPFSEDVDDGRSYMTTRCPAWCDRIMYSYNVTNIIAQVSIAL